MFISCQVFNLPFYFTPRLSFQSNTCENVQRVNSGCVNYKVREATGSRCVQTGGDSCSLAVIMKQSGQHQYLNISWMSELLLLCLHFHYCGVLSHLFSCCGQWLTREGVPQVVALEEFNESCEVFQILHVVYWS